MLCSRRRRLSISPTYRCGRSEAAPVNVIRYSAGLSETGGNTGLRPASTVTCPAACHCTVAGDRLIDRRRRGYIRRRGRSAVTARSCPSASNATAFRARRVRARATPSRRESRLRATRGPASCCCCPTRSAARVLVAAARRPARPGRRGSPRRRPGRGRRRGAATASTAGTCSPLGPSRPCGGRAYQDRPEVAAGASARPRRAAERAVLVAPRRVLFAQPEVAGVLMPNAGSSVRRDSQSTGNRRRHIAPESAPWWCCRLNLPKGNELSQVREHGALADTQPNCDL